MFYSAYLNNFVLSAVSLATVWIFLVTTAFAEVKNIGIKELQLFISEGIPLIDIREEFEWKETGIVPSSHLLTFFDSAGHYNSSDWVERIELIVSRDEPMIIICRSGRRSLLVANLLTDTYNFFKVYNVSEGILGWKIANLETVALN